MTKHAPDRSDRIVEFVSGYRQRHGYAPTVREIAPAVGLSSIGAAHYLLVRLRKAGRLEWSNGLSRSVTVVAEPRTCPHCGGTLDAAS